MKNLPDQFLDKEVCDAEKARFLPQCRVHIYTMVDLSFQAPRHLFHANRSSDDLPSGNFYIHPPMFLEADQTYPLAA